ncbi:hypothetical protein ACJRO7_032976 [Eucalyptus globulus]|uniref:Uncharacterized protein n=1 Tax=Eucalyptus globulus TaxID=34317 RepID=A0ABD3JXW8_EUCGL
MAASACNRAMQRASTSLGPALRSGVRSSPQLGFASPRFPLPARSPSAAAPRRPWLAQSPASSTSAMTSPSKLLLPRQFTGIDRSTISIRGTRRQC